MLVHKQNGTKASFGIFLNILEYFGVIWNILEHCKDFFDRT